jgi:hypothetical protein
MKNAKSKHTKAYPKENSTNNIWQSTSIAADAFQAKEEW